MCCFAKISRPQYRQKKALCIFVLPGNGLDTLLIKTYRVSTTNSASTRRAHGEHAAGTRRAQGGHTVGTQRAHSEHAASQLSVCKGPRYRRFVTAGLGCPLRAHARVTPEKCSCPFHFNYKQRDVAVTKNKPINP